MGAFNQYARFHGDIILLGTTTAHLQPCFNDLTEAGFDLGGSGSALRTPTACVGPAGVNGRTSIPWIWFII